MFEGCSGTAPSPLLELLTVARATASSLRLGSEAVAPQRDPLYFFNSLLVSSVEKFLHKGVTCAHDRICWIPKRSRSWAASS